MSSDFNEDTRVKLPALVHLTRIGYKYLSIKSDEFKNNIIPETNIIKDVFKESIQRINPEKSIDFDILLRNLQLDLDNDDLGKEFFKSLQKGRDGVKLIDFDNFSNNTLNCVTELTFRNGEDEFRPDITIFVNGIPLAFIEVKKPNNEMGIKAERDRMNMRFSNAKFKRFINEFQLLIFSNNMEYEDGDREKLMGAFYATTSLGSTAKFNNFREQKKSEYIDEIKPIDEEVERFILSDNNKETIKTSPEYNTNINPESPTNRIISSLLSKPRFCFFLRYGITYVDEKDENDSLQLQKHIIRYPQYFAMRAIEDKLSSGIKKGVIWHTQGSGKTALAFFTTKYLADYYIKAGVVPKFYFIVDRIDLATQASNEFKKRGLAVRTVSSKEDLEREFKSNSVTDSGRLEICVVNIQKFSDETKIKTDTGYDLNIQRIYFLDEAHRSYNPKGSFLASLYNSDQNSIKIALTGTPIIALDGGDSQNAKQLNRATTRQIFGDYIHKYYYDASIRDGFTLRLIREEIESHYREKLNAIYRDISIQVGDMDKRLIYAHPRFAEPMLDYIVSDLEKSRIANGDKTIGGMIVCNTAIEKENDLSLNQARVIYNYFTKKYGNKYTAALITNSEGDKKSRQDLIDDFKSGKIDFLIVYNMLLTGFDCPRLKKLYLGRTIKAHNLLQTLTRVNRPYKKFNVGYVVDFADISKEFDITNQAYLRELKDEYSQQLDGGENPDTLFGSLFVSKEEVEQKIKEISAILFNYDTSNKEIFSRQINEISSKETLIEIRKALGSAKELINIIKLLGYDDLSEKLNPTFISPAFNEVDRRINLMNATEALSNHENATQLLNLAIENYIFDFKKIGEEELKLAAAEGEDITRKARNAFIDNWDKNDPEWTTLWDEFRRLLNKEQIEHDSLTVEQQNTINSSLRKIYDRMIEINRKNNLLRDKYHGDTKAARVHKKLVSSRDYGFIDPNEVYMTIKYVKDVIDGQIKKNENIIDNEGYFRAEVLRAITETYGTTKVNTFAALKTASEMLSDEYINEFRGE